MSTEFTVSKPDLEYFDLTGQKTTEPWIIQKADSAWGVIDSLYITNFFADYDYKAGVYLYPPTVGMFDPTAAKWVIFLYYNNVVYDSPESYIIEAKVFPNPCNDILQVELSPGFSDLERIKIYNCNGQQEPVNIIYSGSTIYLDVVNLSPGIYFLQMNSSGQSVVKKLIKI